MWGKENHKEAVEIKHQILQESRVCLKDKNPIIWAGFSNGGNLASQIFQTWTEVL